MTIQKYDHRLIEGKWQEKWAKENAYSPKDMQNHPKKFYNLMMFPYPSAEGLHAGNMYAFTGSDIMGRFKRMQGYSVLEPIGLDGFGIHAENYAMKIGRSPIENSKITQENYYKQLHMIGNSFDWSRTVETYDPQYYKWTQWVFIAMFKAGLAYRKKQAVNWCPGCKTVLADEQIMTPTQAGKVPPGYNSVEEVPEGIKVCERCGNIPEIRDLEQWFFRITDYADKLLEGQKKIDWSERVAVAQRNWIGKSDGVYLTFPFIDSDLTLQIYTTAIETIFGATFMVVSPDHPILSSLAIPEEYKSELDNYIKTHKNNSKTQDTQKSKEKTGVFTGCFVKHPLKDVNIPVWVSDYVLMDYGTGAIMAVPAHDARDREFAQNFDLPIIPVVKPKKEDYSDIVEGDGFWDYSEIKSQYSNDSVLFDSESYSGLSSSDAKKKLTERIEEEGLGHAKAHFHLRDWLISRQRYWGPPIPMIYCESCAREGKSWFDTKSDSSTVLHEDHSDWVSAGWYPEDNLPVTLPVIEDYKPKGEGQGPLADHPEFYEVSCPSCGAPARRETDVSDTFLDSSWYFLRYPSVGSESESTSPFDPEITKTWLPVDLYFGGAEHAVLHLMYSRFVTKVLCDLGILAFDEPFPKFYAHGLMIKDGAKMSKSRGNVVNPDEYIEKFGADTLRLYLMFMGPMDGYPDFRDTGIEGMRRFTEKVWRLYQDFKNVSLSNEDEKEIEIKMHKTIKRVSSEVENFRYNTAIASIMEYVNLLRDKAQKSTEHKSTTSLNEATSESTIWERALTVLSQMLAPFAPHMTEELWSSVLGKDGSIHISEWPSYDESFVIEGEVTIAIQVNGKLRGTIVVPSDTAGDEKQVLQLAKEDMNTKRWIEGKEVKKEIFVPGKLVNFVVA